jgi:indolepyruvate ferredoxin oxidoreductase beta subunit
MKHDIVMIGVGGQGILTMAYLFDNAAVARGMHVKQAEIHGMAQRGGAVFTHVRISDEPVTSDLIPEGKADMILSMEPLEVQRYLNFLSPKGMIITSNQAFHNISNYPDEKLMMDALFHLGSVAIVDSKRIATLGGASQGQNMAMVGMALPWLPFEVSDFAPYVHKLLGRKGDEIVNSNVKVIELGARFGRFYKTLLDAGTPAREAYLLTSRLDPTGMDAGLGPRFAMALQLPGAAGRIESLPAGSPCTVQTLDIVNDHHQQ